MTNRESFLIKTLILIVICGGYWELYYKNNQVKIEALQAEVAQIEENLSLIYQLGIPDNKKLSTIMRKYKVSFDDNREVVIKGHNKTASILKTLNKEGYRINNIKWSSGVARITFQ